MKKKPFYPEWVCFKCGHDAAKAQGKYVSELSTIHEGRCEVCNKIRAVTQPRDFGYPKFIEVPVGRGRA